MFIYNIGILPEDINKYEYGEIEDVEFNCPIHCGDSIEIEEVELEVYRILHEAKGKSWLYVKWDKNKRRSIDAINHKSR